MAVYAIADLHLSLGTDKPMDIFGGWSNYVERLEQNWRETIGEADTVVVPGDISWAMSLEAALTDFKFLDSLPGKKIILKGNHDYFWSTRSKMERFFEENSLNSISILHNNAIVAEGICVCGTRGWIFDGSEKADQKVILREAGRLSASIAAGKKTGKPIVCFLHYPPIFGRESCTEILDVLREYGVTRCYYGHLHGSACAIASQGTIDGISYTLISADALKFAPLRVY